ncbi:MAG: hypothetical protein LWX83_19755, partial [Anaerolineae bacterium]|nr:hypothetical protein [Anaerolineae bacterium]
MEKIRELLGRPVIAITFGVIVGLIIGWFGIGWGFWPVEWKDASARELRPDLRIDYLKLAVESYGRNPNDALAVRRWTELGDQGAEALKALQLDSSVNPTELEAFSKVVAAGVVVTQVGQNNATPAAAATPGAAATLDVLSAMIATPTPTAAASDDQPLGINLVYLLILFCVLTLIIGAVLVFLLFIKPRMAASEEQGMAEKTPEIPVDNGGYDYSASEQGEPIAQFMTTYTLGDDLYDDSFSIDSPNGEFLGECGVGVSDTIGVGDPKKVSAFEVWLFDKNDIQTVTKVLMSEHAY